ncbi:photosynthetic complex putative assembly protein PuhB [Rhodopila sp.]|uniref:photosynthetic complex putative assembly protein PuhB n=1 Tax=Rhodopila sp. TaxID=2480087 RepID=UPI003D137094
MNEHDYEPIPGLPGPLPEGETILWQGTPRWQAFARRAMRVRLVTGYFMLLAIWGIAGRLSSGTPPEQVLLSTLRLGGLAAVAIGLLVLFSWLVARTTMYTITTRRVVIRFGIAVPISIQIPFGMIASAGARSWSDGSGDIALTLLAGQRIGYAVLWPHARPWRTGRAEPALRGIADAAAVSLILGRALAASAAQPARAIAVPVGESAGAGGHVPAAA